MKNSQKGFIVPAIIIVCALLIGGGGYYLYSAKESAPGDQVAADITVQPQQNSASNADNDSVLYTSDWGFSVSVPSGWASISTTTPVFDGQQSRVTKLVPSSDKGAFLTPFTVKNTSSVLRSKDFNSEAIYIIEVRFPANRSVFPKDFSDKTLFTMAYNNMFTSLGVTDAKSVTVAQKGSLRQPLTGFYVYATSGSQHLFMSSLTAKDASQNMVGISIVYAGRNGEYSEEVSKNIINSLTMDSARLQPYLDYQLPILTGTIKASNVIEAAPVMEKKNNTKSLLGSARNAAEVYYSAANSYAGYCSSDVNYKKIKETYLPGEISCKDSSTAYAISAIVEKGSYWCVDSTGVQLETKSLNTTVACK